MPGLPGHPVRLRQGQHHRRQGHVARRRQRCQQRRDLGPGPVLLGRGLQLRQAVRHRRARVRGPGVRRLPLRSWLRRGVLHGHERGRHRRHDQGRRQLPAGRRHHGVLPPAAVRVHALHGRARAGRPRRAAPREAALQEGALLLRRGGARGRHVRPARVEHGEHGQPLELREGRRPGARPVRVLHQHQEGRERHVLPGLLDGAHPREGAGLDRQGPGRHRRRGRDHRGAVDRRAGKRRLPSADLRGR